MFNEVMMNRNAFRALLERTCVAGVGAKNPYRNTRSTTRCPKAVPRSIKHCAECCREFARWLSNVTRPAATGRPVVCEGVLHGGIGGAQRSKGCQQMHPVCDTLLSLGRLRPPNCSGCTQDVCLACALHNVVGLQCPPRAGKGYNKRVITLSRAVEPRLACCALCTHPKPLNFTPTDLNDA